MSLLDDIKAKADTNGDGRLSVEDLESLKDGSNNEQIDKLEQVADQNGDGKIGLDDISNFDFGETLNQVKDAFGGMFGGK